MSGPTLFDRIFGPKVQEVAEHHVEMAVKAVEKIRENYPLPILAPDAGIPNFKTNAVFSVCYKDGREKKLEELVHTAKLLGKGLLYAIPPLYAATKILPKVWEVYKETTLFRGAQEFMAEIEVRREVSKAKREAIVKAGRMETYSAGDLLALVQEKIPENYRARLKISDVSIQHGEVIVSGSYEPDFSSKEGDGLLTSVGKGLARTVHSGPINFTIGLELNVEGGEVSGSLSKLKVDGDDVDLHGIRTFNDLPHADLILPRLIKVASQFGVELTGESRVKNFSWINLKQIEWLKFRDGEMELALAQGTN